MTTLEVDFVNLSECALAGGFRTTVSPRERPSIHYGMDGVGSLLIENEPPIRLVSHTLVIVPRNKAYTILASDQPVADERCPCNPRQADFVPGSMRRHEAGDGKPSMTLISGHFNATCGAALDLFAPLTTPIVEAFDAYDQLDQVMNYAMTELAGQEVGGGPLSMALLKLVLLTLLRRCLVSRKAWVEQFSILSDPPIARAFAEMASRPSVQYTVQSLSQSVGLSRSAFMARFTAALGESPMSVLRRLRMRHAAGLLAANALSIDQVALHAGYQSRSSFTRTFRRHYGSDPSEYRAETQRTVEMRLPEPTFEARPSLGMETASE